MKAKKGDSGNIMNTDRLIFDLLCEFNSRLDLDNFDEFDYNKIIDKYPNIKNLFEKYVIGNISQEELEELYILITKNKNLLAALNQYYNQRMGDLVYEDITKQDFANQITIFIDRFKDRLISPMQFINFSPVLGSEETNKNMLFLKLNSSDANFIFAIRYKDNNLNIIDNIKVFLEPVSKEDFDKDKVFEFEFHLKSKIIPVKLKYYQSYTIEDVGAIKFFKYKDELYKFDDSRKITEKDIGYTIKYDFDINNIKNNREKFKKFLNEEFLKIENNKKIKLDLILNAKYIKIIFSDKEFLINYDKDNFANNQEFIDRLIDYILYNGL